MKTQHSENGDEKRRPPEVIIDRIRRLRMDEIEELAGSLCVRLPLFAATVVDAYEAHTKLTRANALKEVGHT